MTDRTSLLTAQVVRTARLVLHPLAVKHAEEMAAALGDPALHRFTGGAPSSVADLRRRYAAMIAGPGRPGESWLNWVVALDGVAVDGVAVDGVAVDGVAVDGAALDGAPLVGWVQATVVDGDADVAWVVGTPWQRRGIAVEAAAAMVAWLDGNGVHAVSAWIHPGHEASIGVARALRLEVTDEVVDGEVRWQRRLR
jgi:RimJ/RimL family protein N-acetyltransferase